MIKAAGLLLIFSALTLTGFYFGERNRQILCQVRRVDSILSEMIINIEEKRLSVNLIFDLIGEKADEETKDFLNCVRLLFKRMSMEDLKKCCIKKDFCNDNVCVEAIFQAFSVFGKISAEEQVSEIRVCREKVRKRYEELEKDIREKIKIYRTLGVLSGFCMVIVLI